MKKIIAAIFFLCFFTSCKIVFNNTKYDYLQPLERRLIDTFNIQDINDTIDYEKFRVVKKHAHDTLKIQEVKFNNLQEIFHLYDTTIVYFATPWCGGYETLLKSAINYYNKNKSNTRRKLIVLNDSYELGQIQDALKNCEFKERVYILDKSYGKKIYKNFNSFKKTYFGYNRRKALDTSFIFFDNKGNIIKAKDYLY